MAGTSRFGSTFTVEMTQDAAAQEKLRTSALGRGGIIVAMRVDALTGGIAGGTTLQVHKVDGAGALTGLSAGVDFATPASAPQQIGGAAWTMVANTSQWIPLQIDEATRTVAAGDSLQIDIAGGNAQLKTTFLMMDANTTTLAVT